MKCGIDQRVEKSKKIRENLSEVCFNFILEIFTVNVI
jgi:hypothetical protein